MSKKVERVVLGWDLDQDESNFVVSPSRFCFVHRLSACQSGAVFYLSRYQFEKNPWLLKQSILLLDLIIKFGGASLPWHCRVRKQLGLPVYLAPRLKHHVLYTMNVSTYCLLNGIASQLVLPMSLVCDSPTVEGLIKAKELLLNLS